METERKNNNKRGREARCQRQQRHLCLDEQDSPLETEFQPQTWAVSSRKAERDSQRNEERREARGWRSLVPSSQNTPGIPASLNVRPRVARLHGCQLTPKPNPEPPARIRKSLTGLTQLQALRESNFFLSSLFVQRGPH